MNGTSKVLSLLILLVLFFTLGACGGAEEAAEPPAAGQQPAAEATPVGAEEPEAAETPAEGAAAMQLPAECSNVQLAYWNPFTGPDGPFMQQMVDQFTSENPNINVAMTTQAEYYTQLATAAASQALPDVAIVHADQVATQAFRNILRPIDDVVGQVGASGDDFPAEVWNAGQVGEQRFAIPLDIHPMTMFYNADLMAAAGIEEPPATREEFEATAEAITTDGNFGFMITTGFPVRQIFEMLLYQFGGTSFNEDGTEAAWNSEAGVQALEWMRMAQTEWSEPNLEVDAELNAFKGGTVGMIWNGIWQTTNVTGDAVAFDGRATAVPQIGDQMAVWAGSHQLTLPAVASPDPCKDAAAAIFIRYLLDNAITWARAGQIPALNSVRESAEFQEVEPQASIAPSVEHAFFPPSVPGITDAYAPLDEAVGSVMAGEATDIQAVLDDAAARANQILEQNRASFGETLPGQ